MKVAMYLARAPYLIGVASVCLMLSGCGMGSDEAEHEDANQRPLASGHGGEALALGSLEFPTTASGDAQEEFIAGVLALHSFWYPEAREHFRRAQKLDPKFGLAYWGEAMSYDNALGAMGQTGDGESQGAAAVSRMNALVAEGAVDWNPVGEALAGAVRERFNLDLSVTQRRDAYANAMRLIAKSHPDHDEVTAFTALAIMGQRQFDLQNPAHVAALASRLEQVYERNPDHPGVLHYLIHLYDTPDYATRGLRQARRYAEIAPASSHALHMPSHIFRHLGMWEEVAASNEDAYAASVLWQERTGRPLHMRDYHAMDWLMDAYLRLGHFDKAERLIKELNEIEAEIEKRGEEWGRFREIAAALKAANRQRSTGESHIGH